MELDAQICSPIELASRELAFRRGVARSAGFAHRNFPPELSRTSIREACPPASICVRRGATSSPVRHPELERQRDRDRLRRLRREGRCRPSTSPMELRADRASAPRLGRMPAHRRMISPCHASCPVRDWEHRLPAAVFLPTQRLDASFGNQSTAASRGIIPREHPTHL